MHAAGTNLIFILSRAPTLRHELPDGSPVSARVRTQTPLLNIKRYDLIWVYRNYPPGPPPGVPPERFLVAFGG